MFYTFFNAIHARCAGISTWGKTVNRKRRHGYSVMQRSFSFTVINSTDVDVSTQSVLFGCRGEANHSGYILDYLDVKAGETGEYNNYGQ